MNSFQAGGTLVLSYSNGADSYDVRIPLAEFDPVTFAYTGGGLKAPLETGVGETVANFGSFWAPYFDASWSLNIEAIFWTTMGTAQRLASVPAVGPVGGTSPTASSSSPPLMRAFLFFLDHGGKQIVRLFGVATDVMGPRRAVSATSGGFDARDQALVGYLAGPGTGLVAWDGQVFPPIATAYQRYKLRPFEGAGPAPAPGPAHCGVDDTGHVATSCLTYPNGAVLCNPSADLVTLVTPTGEHRWDGTGYTLPGGHRLERVAP